MLLFVVVCSAALTTSTTPSLSLSDYIISSVAAVSPTLFLILVHFLPPFVLRPRLNVKAPAIYTRCCRHCLSLVRSPPDYEWQSTLHEPLMMEGSIPSSSLSTPTPTSSSSPAAPSLFRPRRSEDWNKFRPIIEQLYRDDQLKLKDVKRIMERNHSFVASSVLPFLLLLSLLCLVCLTAPPRVYCP